MQRLLAIAVTLAFAGVAGQASALHIHAYTGHEHRDHNHGPSVHAHPQAPAHHAEDEDDDAVHLDTCDPGQHAVPVTIGCAPLPHVDTFHAESASAWTVARLVLVRCASTFTDVRVHGPPSLSQTPSRAPPPTFPA